MRDMVVINAAAMHFKTTRVPFMWNDTGNHAIVSMEIVSCISIPK